MLLLQFHSIDSNYFWNNLKRLVFSFVYQYKTIIYQVWLTITFIIVVIMIWMLIFDVNWYSKDRLYIDIINTSNPLHVIEMFRFILLCRLEHINTDLFIPSNYNTLLWEYHNLIYHNEVRELVFLIRSISYRNQHIVNRQTHDLLDIWSIKASSTNLTIIRLQSNHIVS